jgi:hypothetical protein
LAISILLASEDVADVAARHHVVRQITLVVIHTIQATAEDRQVAAAVLARFRRDLKVLGLRDRPFQSASFGVSPSSHEAVMRLLLKGSTASPAVVACGGRRREAIKRR